MAFPTVIPATPVSAQLATSGFLKKETNTTGGLRLDIEQWTVCCRWEVDKECLPARFNGIWQPHITLTAPIIAVYACLGLAADLAFRKAPGTHATFLGCLYAAALASAWSCWPPAFIRGNRAHAAVDLTGKEVPQQPAVQRMLCKPCCCLLV